MRIIFTAAFFCFINIVICDNIINSGINSNNLNKEFVSYKVSSKRQSPELEKKELKEDEGYGYYEHVGDYRLSKAKIDKYDEDEREKLDILFGYTGPTANDEPENVIRPCSLDDWECIRKYFAANSKCIPSYGPIPDPFKISSTIFYTAVNVTTNYANSFIRGLSSAKVNEFYVNRKSGNLVFAIDVQNLNQTTPRAYYRYRRTAKESIVLAGYSTVNFQTVTFTAVIPKVPHLRLELADVHVDVQDGYPIYFIEPAASNSTDPDVITAITEFAVQLPIIVREALFFESQLITATFIQRNICDFGLKLISL